MPSWCDYSASALALVVDCLCRSFPSISGYSDRLLGNGFVSLLWSPFFKRRPEEKASERLFMQTTSTSHPPQEDSSRRKSKLHRGALAHIPWLQSPLFGYLACILLLGLLALIDKI